MGVVGSCKFVLGYYWWVWEEKCGVFWVFGFYGICIWILKVGVWGEIKKFKIGKWGV